MQSSRFRQMNDFEELKCSKYFISNQNNLSYLYSNQINCKPNISFKNNNLKRIQIFEINKNY
jgi:hypothetical protein